MTSAKNADSAATRWQVLVGENRITIIGVIIAGALGVLVAAVLSLVQESRYVASTSVSFRPRVADVDAAEAADRIAANFASWVESESFAEKLTQEEAGGLAPRQVSDKTRARAVLKEMRVLLEFEDTRADRAASVANGLARVLVAESRRSIEQQDDEFALDIEPMDPARVPDTPVWPRMEIAIPIGATVGLAVSAIFAALLGWFNQPFQPGDVKPVQPDGDRD